MALVVEHLNDDHHFREETNRTLVRLIDKIESIPEITGQLQALGETAKKTERDFHRAMNFTTGAVYGVGVVLAAFLALAVWVATDRNKALNMIIDQHAAMSVKLNNIAVKLGILEAQHKLEHGPAEGNNP